MKFAEQGSFNINCIVIGLMDENKQNSMNVYLDCLVIRCTDQPPPISLETPVTQHIIKYIRYT